MNSLKSLGELPTASRKFLVFSGFNLISWQCIVGSVLVLFGRAIHMPASWVGILLSFLPISMILVIASIPAVERFGPRRLLVITWLIRNLFATLVFGIPFVVDWWGMEAGWLLLMLSILCFSLARAFGVGAWFPWLHEIVPKEKLGTYFSLESIWVQLLTVLVTFTIALVLGWEENLYRFYWVYGVGILAGLSSVLYARKIPGGDRSFAAVTSNFKFLTLRHAFQDNTYRPFIFKAILSLSSIMWINIASVLYLRDMLGLPERVIMSYLAMGAVGVACFVNFGSQTIERFSSHKVMSGFMGGQMVISATWWFLRPNTLLTSVMVLPIVIAGAITSAGFIIYASKAMMSLVPQTDRVGYTSFWIAGSSISNGLPPIIAGRLIEKLALNGYLICFMLSTLSAAIVAVLWYRFPIEDIDLPASIHHMVKPSQPLRNLQRTIWIILGLKKNDS